MARALFPQARISQPICFHHGAEFYLSGPEDPSRDVQHMLPQWCQTKGREGGPLLAPPDSQGNGRDGEFKMTEGFMQSLVRNYDLFPSPDCVSFLN